MCSVGRFYPTHWDQTKKQGDTANAAQAILNKRYI